MVSATEYQIVFQPHLIWRATALEFLFAAGAGYVASVTHANGQELLSWFARVLAALAAVWTLVTGVRMSSEYLSLRRALASDGTRVVEGTISDLHIPPIWERAPESFTVQGVRFSYAASEFTGAFNTPSTYGGPVRVGRHVRVHYLPGNQGYSLSENLILELEVAAGEPSR